MTEPTWTAPLESVATVYAAVVATLAFGWNILRWYKERPKLDITLIPDAELVTPVGSEADLLGVKVVNLGGTSTTIESVSLAEFTTFDRPWLRRPNRTIAVPQPQPKGWPINVPSELRPNQLWTGAISKTGAVSLSNLQSLPIDYESGIFYVQIAASHSKRTTLKRIPRKSRR